MQYKKKERKNPVNYQQYKQKAAESDTGKPLEGAIIKTSERPIAEEGGRLKNNESKSNNKGRGSTKKE